jgi:hypothetical protein
MWNMHDGMGIALPLCMVYRFSPSRLRATTLFPQFIGDVFVPFTSASCKFLKEVHTGDTLYPALEIIAITPQGDTGVVTTRATVHNQRGELVLDGEHQYFSKDLTRRWKVRQTRLCVEHEH